MGSLLRAKKIGSRGNHSEFCWMQGPGIECVLSIGLGAFLLSFWTNRMLLFIVSLCLCRPGQNSGISNTHARLADALYCLMPLLANTVPVGLWTSCLQRVGL